MLNLSTTENTKKHKKMLVIAEKPSVGRDIARVLKCGVKGDGFLSSETHIVSWAIGHLAELCEPDDYEPAYKKWRTSDLPIIPQELRLKPSERTKAQFNILKKLMNDPATGRLICATDSGREGELIFRYIYRLTGCTKPFDRLWISSMTDAAIREGLAKVKPGVEYDALYSSAKCRSEADWLVGINASRAYTLRYNTLLSIGRVQTPTLAIIVARQKEIDAFVPSDYYEILAEINAGNINFRAKWQDKKDGETKITDKTRADGIMAMLTPAPAFAAVLSAETEEKQKPPPLLYDLTELQRDANKKYGYTAQKTLDTAQELYEKRKLITYPRTDSRYLSHDLVPKLNKTITKLNMDERYKPFAARLLALEKLPVTKRIVDDSKVSDHHAIIPTDAGTLNVSALTEQEANIFDLIARRFMAVFYPNYVYNSMTVVTDIGGESFISRGKSVIAVGWTELYKDDKDVKNQDEDDNPELPALKAGDKAGVNKIALDKKKTKPPVPYTESSLLSAMEHAGRFVEDEALKESLKDSGLGTPATRAAIIERLIKVGYIRRRGKALVPNEKGVLLIDAVPAELKSPETTGKWEKGLVSIAGRKMDAGRFMESIGRYVRYIVEQARTAAPNISFPIEERNWAKKK
ncbi:MAG: DNA topoisomerase III [Defluviitaleaceae bacterium]|nr:DNA topoisomerase III [Defluviitaleaceae bacterium]